MKHKLASIEYGRRQLRRLEFLTDVVFGLAIMRLIFLLPRPENGLGSVGTVAELFQDQSGPLAMVAIGLAWTIIFWIQNNKVFGALERTDTRHTVLSILQICAMLLFLYSVRLGVDFDGQLGAMLAESFTAALMGGFAVAGWLYASRNRRLVVEEITDDDMHHITASLLGEPITAILTLGIAALGPGWWTLSWLVFGAIVGRFVRRWDTRNSPGEASGEKP